jgi:Glycogen recognition site of AMP-activated protein kinase
MNSELQAYLDGEMRLDQLSDEARVEAEAWDRMVAAAREATPSESPTWIEHAVMAEIHAMPAHRPSETVLGWLLRPRSVRVSPLAGTLVAAAFAAVLMWPSANAGIPAVSTGPAPNPVTRIFVEFSLQAPGATSVAVAGDFSDWEVRYTLEDTDGDGIWTGRVPIDPGVHEYMFLIDGDAWVTDPGADRYTDDGFGNRNAVLAVAATE